MENKQPVNFYFGGLDKSGLVNSSELTDKTSINYIIFQNDCLHTRVKELENEVRELTNQVSELEDDNESLEISKTNLKGYVKNQGEFNRLSKNLVSVYDTAIGTITKYKDELEWNVKYFGILFLVFEVIVFFYRIYYITNIIDIFGLIEMLIINGLAGYVVMKIYKPYCEIIKIKNIKQLQTVVKIKEQMKESSKGNDFLNELIDRL